MTSVDKLKQVRTSSSWSSKHWFQLDDEFLGASAVLLGLNGVVKDEKAGFALMKELAERGNPNAQFALGNCLRTGSGVEKDEKQAVQWYRTAASQGLAAAQFNLGICFDHGRGVDKDKTKAMEQYRKASEQNYPSALYNLAVCLDNGLGVDKNETQAAECYRQAAELGHVAAMYCFASCLVVGKGFNPDRAQAEEWYRRAAARGHELSRVAIVGMKNVNTMTLQDQLQQLRTASEQSVTACLCLGSAHLLALGGVAQDNAVALKYLRRATALLPFSKEPGVLIARFLLLSPAPKRTVQALGRGKFGQTSLAELPSGELAVSKCTCAISL